MADIQFQVYGINLLVRLLADAPADVREFLARLLYTQTP